MMTRKRPFAARRLSASLVPFRPAATATEAGRSAGSRRRPSARHRPALERMEERTLLSGVTIPTYATYSETLGQTPLISLAPMQDTQIMQIGRGSNGPPQRFQANLQAGEILSVSALSLDFNDPGYLTFPSLQVTGPTGQPVPTGQISSAWHFTAPATGTYTFQDGFGLGGSWSPYVAEAIVRPIALVDHTVDPAASAADAALVSYEGGGLYAWLNAGDTALTFSGPTGIGFQVGGNWSETTSGWVQGVGYTSTYTATGRLSLSIGGSQMTVPLPSGTAFTVSTVADGSDGLFGQVTGENLDLGGAGIGPLLSPFNSLVGGSSLGFVGAVPQASAGIDLGDSPGVQATNLPVDPAIPYLHFALNVGAGLDFGNIRVISADSVSVGVAVDPTNPSIGVDIQGIPVLNEVALELSRNATIPYSPQAAPAQWSGTLYGDAYVKGTLDLAALTGDALPMAATSSITANLDPNHQGLTYATSGFFQQLLEGQMTASAAMQYLDNISVGINGEVDLTLPASSLATIVLPAAEASVIYDGPGRTLYLHADTMDPFANTPIASFLPNSAASFDGTIDFATGQFQFTAAENFSFAGAAVDGQLTLSNSGVVLTFDTTLSESVSVGSLSASVGASLSDTLSIQFDSSGDVSFTLDVTGQAKANWHGQTWNSGTLSYSWWGNADLSYLESQTSSDTQYILNDVKNGVVSWLKSKAGSKVAGAAGTVGGWFGGIS